MNINFIVEEIKNASKKYLKSDNIDDSLIIIPKHILTNVLVNETSNVQKKLVSNGFASGLVYACARMVEMYNEPEMALTILDEAGGIDVSTASEYDLEFLRKSRPSLRTGKI